MTFNVGYSKNDPTDDVVICAGIIKRRFEGITGSYRGLEKLKRIQPDNQKNITAVYKSTPIDGFSCLDGMLLQDNMCGKSIDTCGNTIRYKHLYCAKLLWRPKLGSARRQKGLGSF